MRTSQFTERIWDTSNHCALYEKPLRSEYVTAWCEITAEFIMGSFFFEIATSKGWARTTVTSSSYYAILQSHVIPALQAIICLNTIVFKQYGAPPHITTPVKQLLSHTFGKDNIIS